LESKPNARSSAGLLKPRASPSQASTSRLKPARAPTPPIAGRNWAVLAARAAKCSVLVSKLDRLSRDVAFVSGLMAQRLPFIFFAAFA
jgi:hypothetical protein